MQLNFTLAFAGESSHSEERAEYAKPLPNGRVKIESKTRNDLRFVLDRWWRLPRRVTCSAVFSQRTKRPEVQWTSYRTPNHLSPCLRSPTPNQDRRAECLIPRCCDVQRNPRTDLQKLSRLVLVDPVGRAAQPAATSNAHSRVIAPSLAE